MTTVPNDLPPAQISPLKPARERLIVALDFPDSHTALSAVDRLDGQCHWFKVGLELYPAAGNSIVESLERRGFSIFLDLKLHDIPNTVAGAVRSAAVCGASMLTVHASGGPAMLAAAAEAAMKTDRAPRLLAVTVLTSMDQGALEAVGVADSAARQVLRLAEITWQAGIQGFVSSSEEVAALRSQFPAATLVIPGIRPAGAAVGDQKRIATPRTAIAEGADFLVVGRPITQASDPAAAAAAVLDEITAAL